MKIGIVCSHGGHLTETLQLIEAFEGFDYFFCTLHSERDEALMEIAPAYFTKNFSSHLFRHLVGFFWALKIMVVEKPDAIVSLGADVAIPFFILGKLIGKHTLFIESWCRVDNLSLTGKVLLPIADKFWVQWPDLLEKYGNKAEYKGGII